MMNDINYEGLASIAKKKAAIMGELKRFEKDKKNEHQGYWYPSSEQIFDTIRSLMSAHGLVIFTSALHSNQNEFETNQKKRALHSLVTYQMTWICTDTGGMFQETWIAEADDNGDKGHSKSATLALKYYLMTSFIVSSGDDTDDHDSDIDKPKRGAAKSEAKNKPVQPQYTHGQAMNVNLSGLTIRAQKDNPDEDVLIFDVKGQEFQAVAFNRDLFMQRGWISEDDWTARGTLTIVQLIPAVITYLTQTKGGGYWTVTDIGKNPMAKRSERQKTVFKELEKSLGSFPFSDDYDAGEQ